MNHQMGISNVRRFAAIAFALVMALALTATLATGQAEAGKKKKKTKPVTVSLANVVTANQQQLLKQKKLVVKVKSTGKASPKLSAVSAGKSNYFKAVTVKFKKKGVKKVNLALTAAGQAALGECGAKTVTANANYKKKIKKTVRKKGKKKTKTVTKKAKASSRKKLAKWEANPDCAPVVPPVEPKKPTCDPLDPAVCMQPFPSNLYTKEDSSTVTGLRLDIPDDATPANQAGKHIDPTDINRADGFSVGNSIVTKIPEVSTPAAFNNSGIVSLDHLSSYQDANAPVMVIDADTEERWPIYAELDANPTTKPVQQLTPGEAPVDITGGHPNDDPSNTGDVNLIIRPAKNFTPGHRYVVVLRNLKDASNHAVSAQAPFAQCRDDADSITDAELKYRCNELTGKVFPVLATNHVEADSSLYLAWDFTVASDESTTGRATTIRDDAFERLGDNDLSDKVIEGNSPDVDVIAYCDLNDTSTPQCGGNDQTQSPVPDSNYVQRTVRGFIRDVPCYLDQDGCPTGAKFSFGADGKLTWNPAFTTDVPFLCMIPKSTVAGGTLHPGTTGIYGHGLLGDLGQVLSGGSTKEIGNVQNSVWCATNWAGFAEEDFSTVASSLNDLSNFNKLVDRMQQGFVNMMYLQRAMIHPAGMAVDPAFQLDPDGAGPASAGSVIDTSNGMNTRAMYHGISQGGIMGSAYTALAPDVDYGVLGVPGINYSTLLPRSVDFDEYAHGVLDLGGGAKYYPNVGLYDNYRNQAELPVVFGIMQLLWDRGEGNGYAHTLNPDNGPLENTNPHSVLLGVANGDHQVANAAAMVEARTIGAKLYSPALVEGRSWNEEFFGIPTITPPYASQNTVVTYDGGPTGWVNPSGNKQGSGIAPLENVPPRPEWGYGGDPHGYPRASADGINQAASFLDGTGVPTCAAMGGYCFSNGWDGSTGL